MGRRKRNPCSIENRAWRASKETGKGEHGFEGASRIYDFRNLCGLIRMKDTLEWEQILSSLIEKCCPSLHLLMSLALWICVCVCFEWVYILSLWYIHAPLFAELFAVWEFILKFLFIPETMTVKEQKSIRKNWRKWEREYKQGPIFLNKLPR